VVSTRGVAAVEVGEELLVPGLVRVVELLDDAGPDLLDHRAGLEARQRQAHGAEHQPGGLEVGTDGLVDARVLHLDRDRPLVSRDGAVHLADGGRGDGDRVPLEEHAVGRCPELPLDHAGGQLGRHRRRILLEAGEGLAHVGRQAGVEERRHLAQLHEGTLHVAEHVGDLFGGPQLEPPVELGLALGAGEDPAGAVQGEVGARPAPHPGELGATLAATAGRDRVAGRIAGAIAGRVAADSRVAPAAPAASGDGGGCGCHRQAASEDDESGAGSLGGHGRAA
jgi:hypothetical protein